MTEVVKRIDKFVVGEIKEFVYKTTGGGEYKTKDPLSKRSLKNLPRYSNGTPKVKFQDWLHIKGEGSKKMDNGARTPNTYGKSESDGKWYGWSHRAIFGFGVGDEVKGDSAGKKVTYDLLPNGDYDWDNGKYEPDFTIKNDDQAREVALTFAKNVG